jgi:methionine-R-sulfoxide reductase/methionine-S-sulfoxide reductase
MKKIIYFAAGCFWGSEKLFQNIKGVIETKVGYANGDDRYKNPSYELVKTGKTNFKETVRVKYDNQIVSLDFLVYAFYEVVDPTIKNRQGNDIGTQYQTGIFYENNDLKSKDIVIEITNRIKENYREFYVLIEPIRNFYNAEDYHQNYLVKNPNGYCHLSNKEFNKIQSAKFDPVKFEKKNLDNLSDLSYKVTQEKLTEKPFSSSLIMNNQKGIYVDIVTGEPLFLSIDKYDSICGWPAFSKPFDSNAIRESLDTSHGMIRKEVLSRTGNSHLGHVFDEDSESPTGIHYCINGSALKFIPIEEMEKEGYKDFIKYLN